MVWPVARPPVEDGVVCLTGDRITWVGRRTDLPATQSGEMLDLGETLLLPGLINAHCHLDYTGMAGQLLPPRRFTDWIKGMVALKATWKTDDFSKSWQQGAQMLLHTGTTTVGDIEAVPELLPRLWDTTPLRVISYRELIHLKSPGTPADLVENAAREWGALPGNDGRIGLSPHAPYTTSLELLDRAAREAQRRRWRLVTHVAESEEEFEMFMYRQGPMFDWLKGQRDMSDCGLGSPVQHLERAGYLNENLLAVHVNYLWRHDAGLLGRGQVSVAHCPRSHEYFKHLRFPRRELENAGVNLCLGTDSLATVRVERGQTPELNLFSEMQQFVRLDSEVTPETVFRMATINGARALGRTGELGELTAGALADIIALPFSGQARLAPEAALQHQGPVLASMINGHWAIAPS